MEQDVGLTLRKARERAGYSLADISARTKIPARLLQAIERNDFSKFPPGPFVPSFIRTFAGEVGVDPAEAVAAFRAMTETAVEPAVPVTKGRSLHEALQWLFQPRMNESSLNWGYALVVAVLFITVVSVNRYNAPESQVPANAPQPADVATAADPVEPIATTGAGMQFDIRAEGPCWVKVIVDGETVFARLMQPGEHETLTAERDVIVRVGDPAAFTYSINGKPGQSLGAARVPVTVRFAADGRSTRAS